VALLDDLLKLFGTNRTRMEWKLRAWKRSWERTKSSFTNRSTALTYRHKTCRSCGHPAAADEQVCPRCGAQLGGMLAHRARRLSALVWSPGTPVVTSLVGISLIATYAVMLLWDHQQGLATHPGLGALQPSHLATLRFGSSFSWFIQDGEWWRMVTATFLHGSLMHIIFNVASLWSVGVYLEDTLGRAKTLALYVVLAAVSSAFSFWWHTHDGGVGNSVGASGAICGLIGIAIGFSLRHRNAARHLRNHYLGWAAWIAILGFSGLHIDNAGHIGGLIPGVLLGLVVRRRTATSPTAHRLWIAAALAGVALVVACYVLMAHSPLPVEMMSAVTG
jgi:membrane associated rhomboid family serine protease